MKIDGTPVTISQHTNLYILPRWRSSCVLLRSPFFREVADKEGRIYHVVVGVASYENAQDKDGRRVGREEGEPADCFVLKRTTLAFMRAIMRARRLSGSYIVEKRRLEMCAAVSLCDYISLSLSLSERRYFFQFREIVVST